jgi:hypothetical protein
MSIQGENNRSIVTNFDVDGINAVVAWLIIVIH